MGRGAVPRRLGFSRGSMRSPGVSGITPGFPGLSRSGGWVLHVLLSRSPLASPRRGVPFDLHVLGAPPAFILSQDRTLRPNGSKGNELPFRFKIELPSGRPSASLSDRLADRIHLMSWLMSLGKGNRRFELTSSVCVSHTPDGISRLSARTCVFSLLRSIRFSRYPPRAPGRSDPPARQGDILPETRPRGAGDFGVHILHTNGMFLHEEGKLA